MIDRSLEKHDRTDGLFKNDCDRRSIPASNGVEFFSVRFAKNQKKKKNDKNANDGDRFTPRSIFLSSPDARDRAASVSQPDHVRREAQGLRRELATTYS